MAAPEAPSTPRPCSNSLQDVVIVSAVRTPMCKVGLRPCLRASLRAWGWALQRSLQDHGRGLAQTACTAPCLHPLTLPPPPLLPLPPAPQALVGGFKDTPIDDLVIAVLKETLRRTGVQPEVGRAGRGLGLEDASAGTLC